jgi:starch synthase (maltosyl-transferring)
VVIENISPCVDGGRFAAKRTLGEQVSVQADVFADGHDVVNCMLLYRAVPAGTPAAAAGEWQRVPMSALGNDRWQGSFEVHALGCCQYTIEAWIDHLQTWRLDLRKRHAAAQPVEVELLRGALLVQAAAQRAAGADAPRLLQWAHDLADTGLELEQRVALAQSPTLHGLAQAYPDPAEVRRHQPPLALQVDRVRARYSTWYEMLPRSAAAVPGRPGTLADCEARLPYVAQMGFDVLYLPPIHPIGSTQRRGPNNRPSADALDPGSPWAIGSAAGGHKAIDPALGTLADFRRLVARAAECGIEIALDLAFQCSPDHPYVHEHPEWFLRRPDGSIQHAENPPKQYPDIYPFHFESPAWRELWLELADIVEFWIGQGVHIFRVDNPHTKPFALWEWLIARIRRHSPQVIFLAEAFTRPHVMYRLAKLGFTQSYTYFAWRNTSSELRAYFHELRTPPVSEFLRPNLWPNTPDILSEYLQFGGRTAFMARLVLAATLGASYGIYGPAFELMEHEARESGSEEYRDSEKYQLRHWDLARPDSLNDFIARINHIRRDHPALQTDAGLRFHQVDNEALIAYSKTAPGGADAILTVVNLDPHHAQSGWLELQLDALGLQPGLAFQAHDLLSGARFLWQGGRNYVALDPQLTGPAHLLRIRHRVRSERDFDYFQ